MSPHAPPQQGLIVAGIEDLRDAYAIPLVGVEVRARITGPTSHLRVVQRYRNDAETPVEAVYVFPLEEGSAVCGFRVRIDGVQLEGKVEGRDEAFDAYDDALAEGRTAFLLDQERPDVFTASVGNLLPGQEVQVELETVAEVTREGGALRWRLPTTVSPRYVPASRRNAEGMDDAERISPPLSRVPLPYRFSLAVDVDLGVPLRCVESPSHKTRVEMDGPRARIELAGDEGLMDRDFVLLLHPKDALAPTAAIEKGPDGQRYVGVSFLPDLEGERAPVEVVFVVDCSGSMGGSSMEQARRTLRLCLRSLAPGDRFNLIRFGSRFERYAETSVAYDDAALEKADAQLARMRADLGGTEMAGPLQAAYRRPRTKGLPRRIVLITDGQVANEDELISLAREHADDVQVFAFGVGHGASEHLIRGLARAGRGAAEMVVPGERIEEKVLRHFHRLTGRSLPEATLTWEGLEVEDVLPRTLPPLWAGDPVSFYGRLRQGARGRAVLAVTIDGETRRFVSTLEAPKGEGAADRRGAVALLWARRRIRELEEDPTDLEGHGSQRPDRVRGRRERTREAREAELRALGQTFGLVSSATSYVLVDERPEAARAKGRARFVRVPGQLTRGWHGLDRDGFFGVACASDPACPSDAAVARSMFDHDLVGSVSCEGAWSVGPARAEAPPPPPDAAEALAMALTAEGFWRPTAAVEARTGLAAQRIRELARELAVPHAEEVVATLAVLVALSREGTGHEAVWRPLLEKARRWVARTVGPARPPHGKDWEAWMAAVQEA